MKPRPQPVQRRAMGSPRVACVAVAALTLSAGQLLAAQPIPLAGGVYCGPGDAKITIDVDHDQVTIDKMVCSFPVIAADHLQSDLCSTPEGKSIEESFDFRVVDRDFIHDHAWYRRCADLPGQPAKAPKADPAGG